MTLVVHFCAAPMARNLPAIDIFGSERLTGALLDRLTHHVHIPELKGESYRLKRSRESAVSRLRKNRTPHSPHPEASPLPPQCLPAAAVRGTLLLNN